MYLQMCWVVLPRLNFEMFIEFGFSDNFYIYAMFSSLLGFTWKDMVKLSLILYKYGLHFSSTLLLFYILKI